MTSIKPPVFFEYSANDPYLYDVQFSVNSATDMCYKPCYPHFRSPVCRQREGRFFSDICIIPTGFEPVFSVFFFLFHISLNVLIQNCINAHILPHHLQQCDNETSVPYTPFSSQILRAPQEAALKVHAPYNKAPDLQLLINSQ